MSSKDVVDAPKADGSTPALAASTSDSAAVSDVVGPDHPKQTQKKRSREIKLTWTSDDERRWQEFDARMKAEEALPPEVKAQKAIDQQADAILEHLKPRYVTTLRGQRFLDPEYIPAKFFLQKAPWSPRGAGCKFWGVRRGSCQGNSGLRLLPEWNIGRGVLCFTKIVKLSSPEMMARLCIETADRGAIKLVTEWRSRQNHRGADDTESVINEPVEASGSTSEEPSEMVATGEASKKVKKSHSAAEDISAGAQTASAATPTLQTVDEAGGNTQIGLDTIKAMAISALDSETQVKKNEEAEEETWTIIGYLPSTGALDGHSLSVALDLWEEDQSIAMTDESRLTRRGKEAKAALGASVCEQIKRFLTSSSFSEI